jgi:hypothetical protein
MSVFSEFLVAYKALLGYGLASSRTALALKRIEEYSSGLLVCLQWLRRVQLEVLFWSFSGAVYDSDIGRFQGHRTSPAPPSPSLAHPCWKFNHSGYR